MLKKIKHTEYFKNKVRESINNLSVNNSPFRDLIQRLLKEGGLFIIGGYLRNIANNVSDSRDLDLISTLTTTKIISILNSFDLKYDINRLEGIKVKCNRIELDIWSISKNWSFNKDRIKWKLHKRYRSDVLIKKIADGSFYNFDSIVLNLKTYNCSVSNYNAFVSRGELDILRKRRRYRYQNPTREANILRAYFISKRYNARLSENTRSYLLNEINNIESLKTQKAIKLIIEKSSEYEKKYKAVVTEEELVNFFVSLKDYSSPLFNRVGS